MLFHRAVLAGIADGSVTLAFRRWARPRVRPGTRMRTAVGVLEVLDVRVVEPEEVNEDEARRAGAASRAALLAELDHRADPIHRVTLRLAGPDPRVALREQADLDAAQLEEVGARLARMDAGPRGPWTRDLLTLLRDAPGTRAADLAPRMGRETLRFKADVRRLKELGLTESLVVGYRLSPRGRRVLEHLAARDS